MASPGQLVEVTADALGISKATVAQYDRVLSEHGLRSKSGRGISAAKVTFQDAANLLTAIAGSYLLGLSSKDAVQIFEKFAPLRFVGPAGAVVKASELGLKRLGSLPDGHSFIGALSALLETASENKFDDGSVWVQFAGPMPSAQIVVGSSLFGMYMPARQSKRSRSSSSLDAGLVHTSSIKTPVISALGAFLAGPVQKPMSRTAK